MSSRRKVLVVDDLNLNRNVLKNILDSDYEVLCAVDGREALEILRTEQEEIAAVLLDIVMPVMDGFEVLKEIHMDALLADIPVLVISQLNEDDSELKALNLGASDFVTRPFNENIIKKRLDNLIKMRESAREVNILERDILTHLYNKEAFCHKAGRMINEAPEDTYVILFMDIANFNLVNDAYGINEANNLLKYVADRVNIVAQRNGGFAARVYADRFLMMVRKKDGYYEEISEYMKDVLHSYPLQVISRMVYGIYPVTDKGIPVNVMCDRAAVAQSTIKDSFHMEYIFYDESMQNARMREQMITGEMERALREEQFSVYFQPKHDLKTGQISGAEALVRWIHPQMGFMSPGVFIPIFEKNGFISELDLYVWEYTCKKIVEWQQKYSCYVPISVNVSRKDISKYNLPVILKDMVERHGISPEYLHLEITESAYAENPEQLISVVDEFRALGFEVEMDDFGSGYSSLNMLSELSVDVLKMDMRFIQNSGNKEKARSIMSAIIKLAKILGMLVVAEGVEEKEQESLLVQIGCDHVQGYFYARPMPEKDFEEYLERCKSQKMTITGN